MHMHTGSTGIGVAEGVALVVLRLCSGGDQGPLLGWLAAQGLADGEGVTKSGALLAAALGQLCPRPRYDKEGRRLLWLGEVVVRLRRDAANVERLLLAFEEQNWPERIDDPLPRDRLVPPEDRLRETVKSLLRKLRGKGLAFHADGTGRGVRWARVPSG